MTESLFPNGDAHGVTADGHIHWRVDGDRVRWAYYDSGGLLKRGVRLLSQHERWEWRLLRRGPRFP